MNIFEAHEIASAAAKEAAAKASEAQGGDWGACGFAWVEASVDGRSKIAKELKKIGFSKSWNYGYYLWNPSGAAVQSIDILAAGARVYAAEMRKYTGKDIFRASSRLD